MELWSISASGGGGVAQLTSSANMSWDRSPAISPDGNKVVFQSDRVTGVSNIWVIELGNRGLTQLTNNPYGCYEPTWSPDGNYIVYTGYDQNNTPHIWTMKTDGSERIQLCEGKSPDFSRDGKKIAFSRNSAKISSGEQTEGGSCLTGFRIIGSEKENWDIWIINSDGTRPYQITSDPKRQEFAPRWSPDGNKLVYIAQYKPNAILTLKKSSVTATQKLSEVWIKDVYSGSAATQLTSFQGINAFPDWSPDGKNIVFCSNRSSSWDIWVMTPRAGQK